MKVRNNIVLAFQWTDDTEEMPVDTAAELTHLFHDDPEVAIRMAIDAWLAPVASDRFDVLLAASIEDPGEDEPPPLDPLSIGDDLFRGFESGGGA